MAPASRFLRAACALLLASAPFTTAAPTGQEITNISRDVAIPSSTGPSTLSERDGPKPFYIIAHRVLTAQGVRDALNHGANAVEIDVTAWKKGWWADHDGIPTSSGDTVQVMFETIAAVRKEGKTLTFVWLDIKNPDWCKPDDAKWRHCSVAALQDMARQILEPVGVRVMYGFYNAKGVGFPYIRDSLDSNEAINLNGESQEVIDGFNGKPSDKSKRIHSYGYFNMPFQFGDCNEKDYYTCTELRKAVQSNYFGQVFGWTTSDGEGKYVDKLLGTAGIDGLIYGLKVTYYHDDADARAAAQDILNWVKNHSDKRYIAGQNDAPW